MPRGPDRAAALKAGTFDPKRNLQEALVVAGRKGQRFGTGGYFDYEGKSRTPKPSPEVRRMLEEVRENLKGDPSLAPPRDDISEEEIVNRMMMPLVNEGFKILEEGFAQRPADIDVCYVHGYSFPRRKGGPMHWADQLGLARVKRTLEEIGMRPSRLLLKCVEEGCSLDAYWKRHGAAILERAGPPKRRPAGSPKGSVVGGQSRL